MHKNGYYQTRKYKLGNKVFQKNLSTKANNKSFAQLDYTDTYSDTLSSEEQLINASQIAQKIGSEKPEVKKPILLPIVVDNNPTPALRQHIQSINLTNRFTPKAKETEPSLKKAIIYFAVWLVLFTFLLFTNIPFGLAIVILVLSYIATVLGVLELFRLLVFKLKKRKQLKNPTITEPDTVRTKFWSSKFTSSIVFYLLGWLMAIAFISIYNLFVASVGGYLFLLLVLFVIAISLIATFLLALSFAISGLMETLYDKENYSGQLAAIIYTLIVISTIVMLFRYILF